MKTIVSSVDGLLYDPRRERLLFWSGRFLSFVSLADGEYGELITDSRLSFVGTGVHGDYLDYGTDFRGNHPAAIKRMRLSEAPFRVHVPASQASSKQAGQSP